MNTEQLSEDPTSVVVDRFYPHPPAAVWKALTTPALMEKWLMKPEGFKPVRGRKFTLEARPIKAANFSGLVACTVLEVVEPERLSFSWDDALAETPTGWTVTWELHAEGRGTRVLLSHQGFNPDDATQQLSRTIMGGGWVGIMGALGELLDRSEDPSPLRAR